MTRFHALIWAKLRIARNQIASVRTESKLKVGVVSIAAVLLWIAAFFGFYAGFAWLRSFGIDTTGSFLSLGDIVMTRLLSVLSLALFFMLVFSNTLISFSTVYRSREVAHLLQAPLPIRTFFIARLIECVSFSSWASAYLGSPLILAYGITTDAPWPFYVAAAAFYLPFVTIPAALGALITLVLVRIFPRLPRGSMIVLAGIALVLLFHYLRIHLNAVKLTDETFLLTVLDAMGQTQSPLMPSYWAARGVLDAADTNYGSCIYYFLLLLSNALMLTWVASEVAHRIFYPGWSLLMSGGQRLKKPPGQGVFGLIDRPLKILREPTRSLVSKDIRLFWRDPVQWSQFIIFFGIMALYIANLRNRWTDMQSDMFRNWVVCLNIGACTLICATLTSRFVFPLVSLEGRRFWVLGLAPVTLRQIVWQKFWMSVATTSIFTITLVVLSCIRLEVEPVPFVLAVYSVVITNFALAGLAVGLGSLYPNFDEDNPARIVSGMGGTLNFLLSMGYLALVVGAETLILQWRVLERFTTPNAFWYALTAVFLFSTALSAIGTLIPMTLGLKNLEHTEF